MNRSGKNREKILKALRPLIGNGEREESSTNIEVAMTDTAEQDFQAVVAAKLSEKVLLTEAGRDKETSKVKNEEKLQKRRKKGQLSAAEKKSKGVHLIPREHRTYAEYRPLHELWRSYISEVIASPPQSAIENPSSNLYFKLLKADFHGAILTVSRSKCPHFVGLQGIVVQETKNTFKLVCTDDKLRSIPKENNEFTIEVASVVITLYGNHFCFKSSERTVRKFKSTETSQTIEL